MDYFEGIEDTVKRALHEDVGSGDLTAQLIDTERQANATVITRDEAIFCGTPWATEVIRQVDPSIVAKWMVKEGERVSPDQVLLILSGSARSLLTAERSILNFLQLLSATATKTAEYAEQIAEFKATILDTRKTIPGLRLAQKYAVKVGGGENHRIGLFDAFLIKENHIAAAGSIEAAIRKAREINPNARLEVEVETLKELGEAIAAKPDWVMLDNFTTEAMQLAVTRCEGTGIKLEASGGIENFSDLKKIASTGVDYISLGTLTKSNNAIDLSMRLE